jgi:hypothetical protein
VSKSIESPGAIELGDWVKVNRKPRLASGVKRGEIFQVLRVNLNGVLVIENPHENPKYILSARLGFLDPSEVCLVPRSNRLDTPAFIDVVSRNFPDRLQELLQNPPGVDRVQKPIEVQATEPRASIGQNFHRCRSRSSLLADRTGGRKCSRCQSRFTPSAVYRNGRNFPRSRSRASPGGDRSSTQESLAQTAENSPGVENFIRPLAELDYLASFSSQL